MAQLDSAPSNASSMDLGTFRSLFGDSALIESIQQSRYDLFSALIDSSEDINSNDYLYSRDGRLPTLPIHVAAASADPRFLLKLIQRGADVDDARADPSGPYPEFDNVFRAAVRAGLWDNVKIIAEHGGVNGTMDCDLMWETVTQFIKIEIGEDDEDREENAVAYVHSLLRMSSDQLAQLQPPTTEYEFRRQHRWDCIGFSSTDNHADTDLHELSNVAWTVSAELPHLDTVHQISIIDQLLRAGADVSCYVSSSHVEMWDRRATALRSEAPTLYSSPMSSLGPSYHTVPTPLHTCVLRGNAPLLTHLIRTWHFNPNIPEFSTRAYTPLFLALSRADLPMAAAILSAGGRVDYISPIMRITALHVAAATRDVAVLRWVVDRLHDIDAVAADRVYEQRSLFGHTPLHIACLPSFSDSADIAVDSEMMVRYVLPRGPGVVSEPSQDLLNLLVAAGNGRWKWSDKDNWGKAALDYLQHGRPSNSV